VEHAIVGHVFIGLSIDLIFVVLDEYPPGPERKKDKD